MLLCIATIVRCLIQNALFSALVLALVGLCVWCVWRFFKKKRPKDTKKKNKEGKVEGVIVEYLSCKSDFLS